MPGIGAGICWREVWFTLQAAEAAALPPYLGSMIRGALGHLLRAELCERGECRQGCLEPDTCRYFTLFERSRAADGRNLPKPFVLLAPPPPGLEQIALGAPVSPPYALVAPRPGQPLPVLRAETGWPIPRSGRLQFGMRFLGSVSPLAPAVIAAVARHGLRLGGVPFQLLAAHGRGGDSLWDSNCPSIPPQMPCLDSLQAPPENATSVRIAFLSPTLFKVGQSVCFEPGQFAARFFEHCMVRAMQIYEAFHLSSGRTPWQAAPDVRVTLAGHRLFHYELPRHSFRQSKWLDFDGVVGYLDLEGALGPGMPWARMAEVLHFGQKAVFGLGKLRVFVLDSRNIQNSGNAISRTHSP